MKKTIHAGACALAILAIPAHAQVPVDACALLARGDAEAVIGKLKGEPEAMAAQGSMLGMCTWNGANGTVSVSARPAREFDDTIRYLQRRKKAADPVPGLGAKAYQTGSGLMVQPKGKPYFLQVIGMRRFKIDGEVAAEAARKLKL